MLGEQIRLHRKRFGYTLQQLSQKTHISVGYLSNIERDMASPTVELLDIICNALRIDIVELLRASRSPSPLMKKRERRRRYADQDGVLENAAAENGQYRCTCYTMNPGFQQSVSVPAGGQSGILCYVLSGTMELTMNGVSYQMGEGDTLFIPAHTAHSFRQTGEAACSSLWFYADGMQV